MRRISFLPLCAATCLIWASLPAQTIQINRENKTIAITATDEASTMADIAGVSVGFEVFGPDSETTYKRGGDLSHAILEALHSVGVKDEAIESGEQGLEPNNERSDKSTPEQRAQRQFVMRQSWTVSVNPKFAAEVIRVVVAAGANKTGSIDWRFSDRQALQARAASNALVKARAIAQQMADGLQAKLGALIYASNQAPESSPAFMPAPPPPPASFGVGGYETLPTPRKLEILPQKVHENATVYAVFAIE